MNDLLDKNKSAYKLQGIGPIYCINLDGQPERWEYMKEQFDQSDCLEDVDYVQFLVELIHAISVLFLSSKFSF